MSDIYDAIFVGAGLASLSAASLLAQKGRRVLVLDKHNVAGGYATNFHRKDFSFDVSLHSFDGVVRGSDSFKVIEACGVADKVEFLHHENLYRYRSDKFDFKVKHRDIESYKRQLCQFFPDEAENVAQIFAEAEKNFGDLSRFIYSRVPFWLRVAATPFIYKRVFKYGRETVDQFFSRYTQNEELKALLCAQWSYFGLPPKILAFSYFSYPFIDYLKHGGYSVKGGSQMLSAALVEVIEANGGKVQLASPVTEVIVNSRKRVHGVRTKKDGVIRAKNVITNISPQAVVALTGADHFSLRYIAKLDALKFSISGFQVYLGLDCSLQSLGIAPDEYIEFFTPEKTLDQQYTHLRLGELSMENTGWSITYFSNVDPSMAPEGKSTIGIFTLTGASNWHDLGKLEYREKKRELTELLISNATTFIPALRDHIEVCEAGSPRTMTKFTRNPEGAIYGFEQSVAQSGLMHRFPQKYPIKGLFQVGAWTFPGAGFIGTMLSARVLVDRYF